MRTLYKEDKDIFFRCWWYSYKITIDVLNNFLPDAISSHIDDYRFQEQDRKTIFEIIGYTMSFVLNRLRNDIKTIHGWSDDEYDLNIKYFVLFEKAFDQIFEINNEGFWADLLGDYNDPQYDDKYQKFWNITYDDYPEPEDFEEKDDIPSKIENVEQAQRVIEGIENEEKELEKQEKIWSTEKYNIQKYYVFRMSKLFNIVDSNKMIDKIETVYSNVGLKYFEDAFYNLTLKTIKNEIRQMKVEYDPTS